MVGVAVQFVGDLACFVFRVVVVQRVHSDHLCLVPVVCGERQGLGVSCDIGVGGVVYRDCHTLGGFGGEDHHVGGAFALRHFQSSRRGHHFLHVVIGDGHRRCADRPDHDSVG